MSLPAAILFDLDDTIIGEAPRRAVLGQVANEHASSLSPRAPTIVADALEGALQNFWSTSDAAEAARLDPSGDGIQRAREGVVEATLLALGVPQSRDVAHQFTTRFAELRRAGLKIHHGAVDTLQTLRLHGVRLALVTNGAAAIQRQKLSRFHLAAHFDHVQIEGELGIGKPDPRAYQHAMSTLGVTLEMTWMVGDNLEWEVAAPQRLGIRGIWHDHLGAGLPAGSAIIPYRVIRSLPELLV